MKYEFAEQIAMRFEAHVQRNRKEKLHVWAIRTQRWLANRQPSRRTLKNAHFLLLFLCFCCCCAVLCTRMHERYFVRNNIEKLSFTFRVFDCGCRDPFARFWLLPLFPLYRHRCWPFLAFLFFFLSLSPSKLLFRRHITFLLFVLMNIMCWHRVNYTSVYVCMRCMATPFYMSNWSVLLWFCFCIVLCCWFLTGCLIYFVEM